jgi:uncharacterized protein YjbI with pentapeptide repeats
MYTLMTFRNGSWEADVAGIIIGNTSLEKVVLQQNMIVFISFSSTSGQSHPTMQLSPHVDGSNWHIAYTFSSRLCALLFGSYWSKQNLSDAVQHSSNLRWAQITVSALYRLHQSKTGNQLIFDPLPLPYLIHIHDQVLKSILSTHQPVLLSSFVSCQFFTSWHARICT